MSIYMLPMAPQSPIAVFYSHTSIILWLGSKVSAMGHMGPLGIMCACMHMGVQMDAPKLELDSRNGK